MASGQDNKNKKLHLVGQFYDYTLVLKSDPVRYGQVRSGTVRYGQVRSGTVIRQTHICSCSLTAESRLPNLALLNIINPLVHVWISILNRTTKHNSFACNALWSDIVILELQNELALIWRLPSVSLAAYSLAEELPFHMLDLILLTLILTSTVFLERFTL